jgi:hypothetical protein
MHFYQISDKFNFFFYSVSWQEPLLIQIKLIQIIGQRRPQNIVHPYPYPFEIS